MLEPVPPAPFLYSIAGLSASLAGLAGLVAALTRGPGSLPEDTFRLRQIVEYSFANVLFAISVFPIALMIGDDSLAIRDLSVLVAAYVIAVAVFIGRRGRRYGIPFEGWTRRIVVAAFGITLVTAAATAVTGSVALFELLLILLLARPMIVFAQVLASFEERGRSPAGR